MAGPAAGRSSGFSSRWTGIRRAPEMESPSASKLPTDRRSTRPIRRGWPPAAATRVRPACAATIIPTTTVHISETPTATRSVSCATSPPDRSHPSPARRRKPPEVHAMNRLSRRSLLAAPALLAASASEAQGVLPARGVRIVIGFPVNGGTDEMARVIATALQQRLARPVTIENRPGAAGVAAGEILKKAPTDGSVLAFIPTATVVGKLTTASFPFDPQTDIKPLTLAGTY